MLENKVALVTGASHGIGAAIAKELGRNRAFVYVNYNGSKEAAEAVVAEIFAEGGQGEIIGCNVADAQSVKAMIETIIETKGRLDILVNNAGITKDNLLMKMSESDFDQVIDINLKGCFYTMKYVMKHMLKARSGNIINIASVAGVMGNPGQANYAASKAGVIGMTKTAAKEMAPRGIRVNAVAPGFIETAMTDKISEAVKAAGLGMIPLGRFGKAEEVAKVVKFLASEEASYLTGQVIHADGGMVM